MPTGWGVLIGLLWATVFLLLAVVVGLNRRVMDLMRVEGKQKFGSQVPSGPKIGTSVPADLKLPSGIGTHRARLLLFLNSGCAPCRALGASFVADVGEDSVRPGLDHIDIILVTDERGREVFAPVKAAGVLVQEHQEVAQRLGINVTPFAVAVDANGTIQSTGTPHNFEDVASLAAQACGELAL